MKLGGGGGFGGIFRISVIAIPKQGLGHCRVRQHVEHLRVRHTSVESSMREMQQNNGGNEISCIDDTSL